MVFIITFVHWHISQIYTVYITILREKVNYVMWNKLAFLRKEISIARYKPVILYVSSQNCEEKMSKLWHIGIILIGTMKTIAICDFCSLLSGNCVIFITGMFHWRIWLTVQKLWHIRSIIILEVSQLALCLSQAGLCDSMWIMHVMKKSVFLALLWVYGMHLWCVSFRRQDKHPICVPSSMTSRRIRLSHSTYRVNGE